MLKICPHSERTNQQSEIVEHQFLGDHVNQFEMRRQELEKKGLTVQVNRGKCGFKSFSINIYIYFRHLTKL